MCSTHLCIYKMDMASQVQFNCYYSARDARRTAYASIKIENNWANKQSENQNKIKLMHFYVFFFFNCRAFFFFFAFFFKTASRTVHIVNEHWWALFIQMSSSAFQFKLIVARIAIYSMHLLHFVGLFFRFSFVGQFLSFALRPSFVVCWFTFLFCISSPVLWSHYLIASCTSPYTKGKKAIVYLNVY